MKKDSFSKRGFTLVEILIVMALLGALAVGMLAAIDPLEQFRKGADTSVRNTLSESYSAFVRYYALKTMFPWMTAATEATGLGSMKMGDLAGGTYITDLINAGELKADFVEMATPARLNQIILSSVNNTAATLCFLPTSKGFQKDVNTKFDATGGTVSNCKSTTTGAGATDCFWCVK